MESLKQQIARTIAAATQAEGMEKNKVIILTSAGLITGTVYAEDRFPLTDLTHCLVPGLAKDVAKDYDASHINGDDGYIPLSDVTVTNFPNNVLRIPSLVVFYDQIVGITFGNID